VCEGGCLWRDPLNILAGERVVLAGTSACRVTACFGANSNLVVKE